MNTEEALVIVSKADYWQFSCVSGLRLDGYYSEEQLRAFAWLMENDEKALEKAERK